MGDFIEIHCPTCNDRVDFCIDDVAGLKTGTSVTCPACDMELIFTIVPYNEPPDMFGLIDRVASGKSTEADAEVLRELLGVDPA